MSDRADFCRMVRRPLLVSHYISAAPPPASSHAPPASNAARATDALNEICTPRTPHTVAGRLASSRTPEPIRQTPDSCGTQPAPATDHGVAATDPRLAPAGRQIEVQRVEPVITGSFGDAPGPERVRESWVRNAAVTAVPFACYRR
jgi:hypothetical protein